MGLVDLKSARALWRLARICVVAVGLASVAAPAAALAADRHLEEAFEAAQWALLSSAGNALQQLGLRAAAGSPELAGIVRQRQDLVAMVDEKEKALGQATSAGASGADALVRLRGEIDSMRAELVGVDTRLARSFPRYADLAHPKPLSVADVQALLEEDEGLLLMLAGHDHIFAWGIGKHDSAWTETGYGAEVLGDDIARLRAELDPAAAARGARTLVPGMDRPRVAPFDRLTANILYGELVRPVETALKAARHVFVVNDGPLAGLPLSVLVASAPVGEDTDPEALRRTDWLARHYAFTTLPSVDSLAVIRKYPPPRGAEKRSAFRGFGAPVLGGETVQVASASSTGFFRGSLADVEAVRDLPALPQTGPELRKLAAILGAPETDLYIGARASEIIVKQADLSTTDVLAFATHGLLSGDLRGLAEPALVLTPPQVATAQDDGLLTASEVAELKLSAQWVILSACNTAGGDGRPDAEGLSGLARAFLYAGARAILVSHWPVRDDAAARLTTQTLAALGSGVRVRRAEALRLAMLDLMGNKDDPSLAHPSAWAPFVIVGEGGY
ncbi:CHAT domain-containing protein [Mesorhizobium sp. 131-2-1]|uniref:CHAT domain-containing protein n=1 Tax=Mesorhizobium sp. 131-2-1 TaxID=2744518 RepID=UPI0019277F31|nr:CHAT domain-containing protein [Mesorhizobium sp. 131-2-1]BCG95232.1 hypothetical protein MesoLj131a_40960 [Mesorhizobium sp. 131-2-1]